MKELEANTVNKDRIGKRKTERREEAVAQNESRSKPCIDPIWREQGMTGSNRRNWCWQQGVATVNRSNRTETEPIKNKPSLF